MKNRRNGSGNGNDKGNGSGNDKGNGGGNGNTMGKYDSLTAYLNSLGQFELLTREEEVETARKVRAGDENARERMINANLRLVVYAAKAYAKKNISLYNQLLDLIGEGNEGLIKAVERFDPDRGFKFSTYAQYFIKDAIIGYLKRDKPISVSEDNMNLLYPIIKILDENYSKSGRELSSEDLANAYNALENKKTYKKVKRFINPEKAQELIELKDALSKGVYLDSSTSEDIRRIDELISLAPKNFTYATLFVDSMKEFLEQAVDKNLTKSEKEHIRDKYFLELSSAEITEKRNRSHKAQSELKRSGLKKLERIIGPQIKSGTIA
jgi:RNA polymerase primary sigma factor